MSNKLMYSTETGSHKKDKAKASTSSKNQGPCKMRLETNGRGGKAVTVLFNLPFTETEAKNHMKDMQSKFGCGATYKNNTIELRGDVRERVESYFASLSLKVVRAGG